MSSWLLEIRNAAGQIVAACEDYTDAVFAPRWLDVGMWALTLPLTSSSAGLLLTPGYGIRAELDSIPVISGPAITAQGDTGDGSGQIHIAGVDDMTVLADRLASPQPSAAAPPYSGSAYDVRGGIAESVIKAYVSANAGPSAVPARRWPGLTIAPDLARGSTVSGNARWPRLLDLGAELAVAGGLGLKCVDLTFDVVVPVDRSAMVEFSDDRGSLGKLAFEQQAPTATYVYVAGGGEGVARTFLEQAAGSALAGGWWRRERFRDARDTSDLTVMAQRATEELDADLDATKLGLTVDVTDVEGCRWPTDYALGDIVAVVTPWGVKVSRRVTAITIALSAEAGTTVTPTLGVLTPTTPETSEVAAAVAALMAQARRIARLETR